MSASHLDKLTVVILNYNTHDLLKECLEHLGRCGVPQTQIIVVDNGSQDASPALLRVLEGDGLRVHLLAANQGFAAGNNIGIAAATSDYVLLLNTDAFPDPGSLEIMIAALERIPAATIAGPQLMYRGGRWQRCTGALPTPRTAMLEAFGIPTLTRALRAIAWPLTGQWWPVRAVGYVDGACMLIRRRAAAAVGYLDDGYFFYAEDVEYCERMWRNGCKVIHVPRARVTHLRGASSAQKNLLASARLKRDSMRRYIAQRYGTAGWDAYARWTHRNFAWRGRLCRLAHRLGLATEAQCATYAANADVYAPAAGDPAMTGAA